MSTLAGELVMRCFHARTIAHVLHLKSRSYAAHKALNEFYDEIVDLADSFAEVFMGCEGQIESFPNTCRMSSDATQMLNELYRWIDDHRSDISDESHIQNIVDEIQSLIDSTLYKLTLK